jgi:hypothetical protein
MFIIFLSIAFSEDNSAIESYYDDHNGAESANEDQNKTEGDADVGERKSEFFFVYLYLSALL